MKLLIGGALIGIALLSGCVEPSTTTRPAPTVSSETVLTCPTGADCRAGGQSGVRVTVDEYGYVRGQAVIEQWSQWGDERPPIKFEPIRQPKRYYNGRQYDPNKCYWYKKQNGEKACL